MLIDARWVGTHGIARFAHEVSLRLPPTDRLTRGLSVLHPLEPAWLAGLLLLKRPDVYFSPGFNPPLWSPVPYVFTIHDLIHLHVSEESTPFKRAYYQMVVRPAARRAYRVLTVSEFSKAQIAQWTGISDDRIVVVGNGVSSHFSPEGVSHSPGYPYVLYVGNHKPHKNLSRLLMAFARTRADRNLRLVLTGHPDTHIQSQVHDLGIADRVVFAGTIPEEELPNYYRGATTLVLPSLYEGFGLPVLEAMSCGTPVVASAVTSLPEVAGDAAVLVDPVDIDAIADGIDRVVNDDQLRRRLRTAGLARSRGYTWDRTGKLVREVLQEARK